MKNLKLIFCGLVTLFFIIISVNIFKSDDITISKSGENHNLGMTYNIDNLKKGTYKVNIYAKEYKNGKFIEEYRLYDKDIKHKSKNISLKVGVDVSDYNKEIKVLVNDSYSKGLKLNFFENDSGSLLIIENSKVINLDKEEPIVVFNTDIFGKYSDISDGYNIEDNEGDLIVFLKLIKIN